MSDWQPGSRVNRPFTNLSKRVPRMGGASRPDRSPAFFALAICEDSELVPLS